MKLDSSSVGAAIRVVDGNVGNGVTAMRIWVFREGKARQSMVRAMSRAIPLSHPYGEQAM